MQLIVNCMENLPKKIISQALTYDDVLLVPGYSNVLPRVVNINSTFSKFIPDAFHVSIINFPAFCIFFKFKRDI